MFNGSGTVAWRTNDNSHLAGSDYTAVSTALSFAIGQGSKTVAIAPATTVPPACAATNADFIVMFSITGRVPNSDYWYFEFVPTAEFPPTRV